MSREAILRRVRENNKAEKVETKIVQLDRYIKNDGDLYENFKTNLANNKTIIHECTKDKIEQKINELLKKFGTKNLMFGSELPLNTENLKYNNLHFNKSINDIYNEAFECDSSIVEASYGVSNFGIFCVTSSKNKPRLLSLLPKNCVVLLKKDKIVETMYDAFVEVTKDEMSTNIIFIIGPSRTSDIELELVLGVHGPQNVHVILYD